MKFMLCLLALVTLAMCRTIDIDERFIVGDFTVENAQHYIVEALGSDVTEALCESSCPNVLSAIPGGALAAPFLCKPACQGIQSFAQG